MQWTRQGTSEAHLDILRMLETLQEEIDRPKSFGPIIWGLNRDELSMQIMKIRASLPQELKQAASLTRESERIMDAAKQDATATTDNARREGERIMVEAKKEAERLMEEARLHQERLVGESEILKLAKSQAEEIRNGAEREAQQLRRGAENYAFNLLNHLEGVTSKMLGSIESGKSEIQRLPEQSQLPATREKTRA